MPYSNTDPNFFINLFASIKDIVVGLIGGMVGYLINYTKHKKMDPEHKMSIVLLIINVILGGYAAYMFGSIIPKDAQWRDFALGVIGVSSYPIMVFIESKGLEIVMNKISDTIGVNFNENESSDKDDKKGNKNVKKQ